MDNWSASCSDRLKTESAGRKMYPPFSSLSEHARTVTGSPPEVLRNDKGFVLTDRDAVACNDFARCWKAPRQPLPLETTVPGIFAAGDLRAGAMNRVASAVGEGSMAVKLVHEYLALT